MVRVLHVLMLAAAVAAWDAKIGDVGNVCPSGYEKITSWVACRAALDVVGLANDKYEGVEDAPDWPSGCYYCKSCGREVWFNSHATGAAAEDTNAKPICAKDLEPLTAKTLFLGDSDMDYYPTKDDFPDSHNLGYAGYNCNEVNVDLDAGLLFAGIEWVVLVCGENDLAEGTSVADTYNRFETAVSEITAYGAQVLSLGTKPEPDSHDLWQKYQELDQLYIGLAQTKASSFSNFAPLVFIDTYQNFLELGNPNSFYSDGLHLSTQGYAYWTTWATKAMAATTDAACIVWHQECHIASPTMTPTVHTTPAPTVTNTDPTTAPTVQPTLAPTVTYTDPTHAPTFQPTLAPTVKPTHAPTVQPTPAPTTTDGSTPHRHPLLTVAVAVAASLIAAT